MLQRPNPLAYSSFYSGHDSSNDEEEARRREVIDELDELSSRQEQISKQLQSERLKELNERRQNPLNPYLV